MLYSCMSPEQRKTLLDDRENYPMRVRFLGKVGIMTQEELAFLRENEIDFDVDDRGAAAVLGPDAVRAAQPQAARVAREGTTRGAGVVHGAPPGQQESLVRREARWIGSGCLLLFLRVAVSIASAILRRLTPR